MPISKQFSAIFLLISLSFATSASAQLTVMAASEVRPALEEVRRVYTERTGNPLRLIFGNPAEVLAKAAQGGIDAVVVPVEWIDSIQAKNLSSQEPVWVANSPLAVWSRQGRPLPDEKLQFLLDTTIHGIAISDPKTSPDGLRVHPYVSGISADSAYQKRILTLPDPSAAIDAILGGKADAALLPQSAFWSSQVGGMGRQLLLDSTLITPQRTMSLILNVTPDRQQNARHFLGWATGPQAKGIWRRNGFLP